MQSYTHQAAGSSDAALRERYRVALVDFVETYDARRHGGAFPANLLKTNFKLEGFKFTNFDFRSLLKATADIVRRDTCRFLGFFFKRVDVDGHDLANLVASTHRAGLTKQFSFSDLRQAKPAYVAWSR